MKVIIIMNHLLNLHVYLEYKSLVFYEKNIIIIRLLQVADPI